MSAPSPEVEPAGTMPRVSRTSAWPVEITTTFCGASSNVVWPWKWTTVRGNTPSFAVLPLPSGIFRGMVKPGVSATEAVGALDGWVDVDAAGAGADAGVEHAARSIAVPRIVAANAVR